MSDLSRLAYAVKDAIRVAVIEWNVYCRIQWG
jgi:hypothetical protein